MEWRTFNIKQQRCLDGKDKPADVLGQKCQLEIRSILSSMKTL